MLMAEAKKQVKQTKSTKSTGKKAGKVEKTTKKKVEKVEIPHLPEDYIPRLKSLYLEQIAPALSKKFKFKNKNLVPKLAKIVLNVGIGTMHQDAKLSESIAAELALMSGQKPVFTKAKRSISNFKLREGMTIGCMVTLRRDMMYEFFDRLITVVIPRIRDFRGLNDRSFDGRGNYTFGIKEQIIFPEIDYDNIATIHGMDITICTTAHNDEEALHLLREFGFPIRRNVKEVGKDAA